MSSIHSVFASLLVFSSASVFAAPLPATPKVEVNALLARLEGSGCRFNRNGSWHSSQEARAHLQGKFEYFEKKLQGKNAEAFIEMAATSSSVTGKPYLVQCDGQQAVESATWLSGQLAIVRKQLEAAPRRE